MRYFVEFYASDLRLNQREHIGTRSLQATTAPDAEREARTLLSMCHRSEVDFALLFEQPERENYSLLATLSR